MADLDSLCLTLRSYGEEKERRRDFSAERVVGRWVFNNRSGKEVHDAPVLWWRLTHPSASLQVPQGRGRGGFAGPQVPSNMGPHCIH